MDRRTKNILLILFVLVLAGLFLVFATSDQNGTFTKREIQQLYQTDPMSADVCKEDPSSQSCLDVWNLCNGNPQKPVEERVIGCFDRYTFVSSDLPPVIELTGFTSEFPSGVTDPNQVVYRPE